eukprot:RCo035662
MPVPRYARYPRPPAAGSATLPTLPPSAVTTTNRIFVGRLPPGVGQEQLLGYFQQFGPVTDCYVPLNHATRLPRGIAFVTFASEGVVDVVVAGPHKILGQEIAVDRAEPRKEPPVPHGYPAG